jgi:membrane protein implicated in regulation of membrane protease activity
MKAGWKTWLVVAAWVIGAVIVVEGFFLLFGWAWYSWGFLGAFLVICVLALAWAYFYDRRRANRRKNLAA